MDTVINRRYLKVVGSFPTHVCGSKNGSTDASYRRCVSCLTLVSDSDTCRSIQLFSFLKLLLVLVCQGLWCLCLCRCFISCNLYPCRGCLFQGNDLYQSFQLCKLEKWKPTIISDEDAVFLDVVVLVDIELLVIKIIGEIQMYQSLFSFISNMEVIFDLIFLLLFVI